MRQTYKARRDVLIDSFAKAGWTIPKPSASMFAWTLIPEPFRHLGSVEFSKRLMEGAEFAVAPGAGFGEYGDQYVRLAFVENEARIRQAARNLKKVLQTNSATQAAE
jgi:alanine-synthesizing transaminase